MKTHELLTWLTGVGLLLTAVQLAAEETAVVEGNRVNVRGQPSLVGEVITQLQEGEKVVVLEEITLTNPRTNEPPKWVRIQMPANTPVWVYAPFIDADTKTVKASRLNLRAGPGENYSVVGRLERGSPVREIRRVEDWMEIETPVGAYAFVAADLLSKSSGVAALPGTRTDVARTAPVPPPTLPSGDRSTGLPGTQATRLPGSQSTGSAPGSFASAPVQPTVPGSPSSEPIRSRGVGETVMQPIVQPRTQSSAPAPAPSVAAVQTQPSATAQAVQGTDRPALPGSTPVAAAPAPGPESAVSASRSTPLPGTSSATPSGVTAPGIKSAASEPLERRVVRREGIVRSTVSIQAPTYFELLSPANRKTINYLHTENLGINMRDYRGRRIIVTGEEAIDPRWPKTPVIEVETLELVP